jgi:ribosomal protein S12 methylthiotransferase
MAGLLRDEGYRMVAEPEGADFVVVNTCGFIGDARNEAHGVIREMLALKQRGRLGGVIVAGCLAQRDGEQLLQTHPGIDQLVGVFGRDEIATAARRLERMRRNSGGEGALETAEIGRQERHTSVRHAPNGGIEPERTLLRPAPVRPLADGKRLRITPPHLAFLKIAEGCNRSCSFCTIPQLRGGYASKSIEQVVAEAEELVAEGTRELVLIAQDTSFYGIDLYGRPRLAELLARLEQLDGLAWIRLMYLYPLHVSEELIERLACGGKILPYLDLPLQHIDDEVLRRMRRQVTGGEIETLLDRLRQRIPRLVVRTTLIAGFPGETEDQFARLVEFVEKRRFERLGAFAYSREAGTPAAELDGHLPDEVRNSRRDRLLAIQQPIAFAWNGAQVGRQMDVILDRGVPGQRYAFVGRSYADAPEVDGTVYVSGKNLAPGQIVACEVVAARGYDLIAAALV